MVEPLLKSLGFRTFIPRELVWSQLAMQLFRNIVHSVPASVVDEVGDFKIDIRL
ncbi:hypothetical protein [Shimia sp.]|uniref:hypothetical protein n=1 Tax=Shimia sp. TaxID=1954381 RepID=UPI003B8AECF3